MSDCSYLLQPSRWQPRLYGDWRASVPLRLLPFQIDGFIKEADYGAVAEFLGIEVSEVVARCEWERVPVFGDRTTLSSADSELSSPQSPGA